MVILKLKNGNFIDIDEIQVSIMVSSGEKNYEYFIGYKDDDHKITPLHIMLVKKIAYVKSSDGENKWM